MDSKIYISTLDTEFLGLIGVTVSSRGLLRLRMFQENKQSYLHLNESFQEGKYVYSDRKTKEVIKQILAYLKQDITEFTLPIDWSPYTPFQRAVLERTLQIPYGETCSYGEIAAAVGNPKAARAVGQAEKNNQVPLVIPCHRVIGSDGSLTGYGGKGNVDLKAKLLVFEQALLS
jgi:methylated-DNA-[protein]-cysteine S-methyltransferase